jgi:8-oxo-dGTP pyrophosphatase MutT (NUDIX family)
VSNPSGHRTGEVVPEDAVTVIVVRDAIGPASEGGSLEVLLLERHGASAFAPGALVFPGGRIDQNDGLVDRSRVRCGDPAGWAQRLGVESPDAAITLLIAGIRETFEEAGVLLAVRSDGVALATRPVPEEELAATRARMAARDGAYDWRGWLERQELVLDLDAVCMWSWWVTPAGLPRRYDTRFLLAAMPSGQRASQDDVETTSLRWIRPIDALAEHAAGHLHVIYPTRCTLEQLSAHPDSDSALRAARDGAVDLRRIEPTVVRVDGQPMVQHPDGGPPARL